MVITKSATYILLFLLSTCLLGSTCRKSECFGSAYTLKESWNIVQPKDSIAIGDSIRLFSTFSNHPFDYISGAQVNFSGNALIGTPLIVRAIKGIGNLEYAVDSFFISAITGRADVNKNVPGGIKDLYWEESGGLYKLDLLFIARKKGDYIITLSDAIGRLKKANECEDGATILLTNKNVYNNAELFQAYYGQNSIPADDSTHIYCIRVK